MAAQNIDYDVFLCHNHKDKPVVRQLAEVLQRSGVSTYLDEEALPLGLPWRKELEGILQTIPSAAVLVGSEGLGDVQDLEVTFLLGESGRRRLLIIPVLLPNGPSQISLPPLLQSFQWIDLRDGLSPQGLDRLTQGILSQRKTALLPTQSLPASRNLPFGSLGSLFRGRDEHLCRIAQGSPAGTAQVILGLPGAGKTRLAVEYAWRYGTRYKALLFVRSESPEGLPAQIAALARFDVLRLQVPTSEEAQFVVRRWLKENRGWLLILDGVDTEEAAAAILQLLPDLGNGHVLITARVERWPANLQVNRLPESLSLEEAVHFLLDRTAANRMRADDDTAQAYRLAEILDGLPLALEQVGAYIASSRTSFAACLEVWEEERERLLGWHDRFAMDHLPLAVTWQQIFQQLSLGSGTILRLAAHLTPEPIPLEMFRHSPRTMEKAIVALGKETGRAASAQKLESALEDLVAYSMISLRGTEITIHGLVQEVVLALIPPARRRDWIRWALSLVDAFAPAVQDPAWDVLLPHALRVLKHAGTVDLAQTTVHLVEHVGLTLKEKGRYAEAEPLLGQALENREILLGPAHPDLVADLVSLAELCMAMARESEAESLYRRALAIHEAAHGASHPEVALALNNLASVLTTTGRPATAEPLYRRALDIDTKFFGAIHPRIATDLQNIASLLRTLEKPVEAEPLLRRALVIEEAVFGPDHEAVGYGLRRLGYLLQSLDRSSEARPLLQRALALFEQTRTSEDPLLKELRERLAPSSSSGSILEAGEQKAPPRRRYIDFTLELSALGVDEFAVAVTNSPTGLGQSINPLKSLSGVPWATLSELGAAETLNPETIGRELFEKVFTGEVLELWHRSRGTADRPDIRLRLKLHIAPRPGGLEWLSGIPWEFLYDPAHGEFLALGTASIIRTVDTFRPAAPLRLSTHLRIVVAVASPLATVYEELPGIETLGGGLSGAFITSLPHATPRRLRETLLREEAHVLYLMGPSGLDAESGQTVFLLESENGGSVPRTGSDLAELLHGLIDLRLVIVQASSESRQTAAVALASALVLTGIPAVVAMQCPVSGKSAALFATSLLRRLVAGDPVDAAVLEGRLAVRAHSPGTAEWASPALFLSAPDGRLFDAPSPAQLPGKLVREHVLDFSPFIADKTAGFVGREWVFKALDRFVDEKSQGYLILRGDPGIGKSALMAELVRRRGYLHHFNIRAEGIQRPETFLASICAQIILRYELPYTVLPPSATQDSRFLVSLLETVSRRLLPSEKVILLVDALDEASGPVPLGANPLYLPHDLPPGAFILVTSRRGLSNLQVACELAIVDLEQDFAGNIADIRELVVSHLAHSGIKTYLAAHRLEAVKFADVLVARSQGNFIYLRHVLREIEIGSYGDRDFTSLPVGIQSYYEDHWRRMRARDEEVWFGEQLPVLVALTVAREAIPVDLIAALSGVREPRRIEAVLRDWEPFLYMAEREENGERQKCYRLYHESFHDFIALKDEVGDDRVDLRPAHRQAADALWRGLFGDE